MPSKWSSLSAGKISGGKVSISAGYVSYYSLALPFLVILVVVLVLIFRKKEDTSGPEPLLLAPQGAPVQPIEIVVGPTVEGPGDSVEPVVSVDTENTLEPKFNVLGSKYWSFNIEEDEPHLENDGNTFTDFQKAFSVGREVMTEDNSMTTFRNENMDTFLHDQQRKFVPKSDISLTDSHSLALEAFQNVPKDLDRQNAIVLLREILSARTESAKLGLDLPSISDDQVSDLEFWASKSGTESDLAKSILSRL
jgi:hypothetical protein